MRPLRKQGGIALLEALLATVLLAIGLLGAIGMQARAYSALSDAGLRAEATVASEKLLALMSIDQANLPAYAYAGSGTGSSQINGWLLDTRAAIPGAAIKVAVAAVPSTTRSQVDISISWQRKEGKQGSPPSVHAVTAYIANSK